MAIRLEKIIVFPIKSLDGVSLARAELAPSGGLQWDRRWALVDAEDAFLNGKRNPAVHRLRAAFDLEEEIVRLADQAAATAECSEFSLRGERGPLQEWLSDFFHLAVRLVENREGGFPDDTAAPGPTLLSTQTLQTVAGWYGFSLEEARRRFRANLEIDAAAPFWEDRLFTADAQGVAFQIGDVSFLGINPCARCAVPSRSTTTGQPTPLFAKTFAQRREATLPPWAMAARFDHYYRLAVNTKTVTAASGAVCVGDAVRILGSRHGAPP